MTRGTTCIVTYPIVSALAKAVEFLKDVKELTGVNDKQQKFLSEIYAHCKDEIPKIEEIESIADLDVSVINEWLKNHGFDIELNPVGPAGFAVASMLDVIGKWATKGTFGSVVTEDRKFYPGVKMTNSITNFYKVVGEKDLVVEFETKNDDQVYMMMSDEVPKGLVLIDHVVDIHQKMIPITPDYDGVMIPKIDLDITESIDWIINLKLETPTLQFPYYIISQALQQTKLKLNEEGFRVKSAVALATLGAGMPRVLPYMINRPFLMWIKRPSLTKPFFIGYLNTDVWKDPGGLEM